MLPPAIPKPWHRAEARQRRIGLLAMAALGVIGLALTLQLHLTRAQDDIHLLRTTGPLRASTDAGGTVQLGPLVTALRPGEQFGWVSSFCVRPASRLLLQSRLVHLADGQVVLYRESLLATDAQGCTSGSWSIVLPRDTPPGAYYVQRFLLLTPQHGEPRTHTLPPVSLEVMAAS